MNAATLYELGPGLMSFLNLACSIILGLLGLWLACTLKNMGLKGGGWFTSLRYVLGAVAIAAFSNAYTLVILGHKGTSSSQISMNISILMLFVWVVAYYFKNVLKNKSHITEETFCNFLMEEDKKLRCK